MIIFDTETTGLPKGNGATLDEQPHLIEIAIIKVDDYGKILQTYETLVNPGVPIPAQASKVNGITDEMVKDAPSFTAIYPTLYDIFLGERKWCAYNLVFDKNILRYALCRLNKQHNFPWPSIEFCAMNSVTAARGRRIKMKDAYEWLAGKEMKEAHRAMVDAYALYEMLGEFYKRGYQEKLNG